MLRELFPFAFATDETPAKRAIGPAEPVHTERLQETQETRMPYATFDEVYRNSPVKSSKMAYTILKVAEMADSPHLTSMSGEAKRSSILMALEAAGATIDDILQDAMVRQRALNDYEEGLQRKLKELEGAKLEENRQIQAELDRVTAEHIGRIQLNLDELARQQDTFRAWQKEKQQETRRISEAAAICVPQNMPAKSDSVALVLERVTVQGARR